MRMSIDMKMSINSCVECLVMNVFSVECLCRDNFMSIDILAV